MKRIYVPWYKWECYANGMWRTVTKNEEQELLLEAIKFTGNHILYGNAMLDVILEWPNSMLHFLSNPSINKRAYLGHCAACLAIGSPEYITRLAWKELTDKQRIDADYIAQETLNEYFNEIKNKGIHKTLGIQVLS